MCEDPAGVKALNRLQALIVYLAIIVAVVYLGDAGKIGEQGVVALLGVIAGYVGGAHSSSVGVSQGAKAAQSPPAPEPEA